MAWIVPLIVMPSIERTRRSYGSGGQGYSNEPDPWTRKLGFITLIMLGMSATLGALAVLFRSPVLGVIAGVMGAVGLLVGLGWLIFKMLDP